MPAPKPPACSGCRLEHTGTGFVPPVGPEHAPILLFGEAAGRNEAYSSTPFVGDAGGMLNRILKLNHHQRIEYRIGNTIQCQPPGDWLEGSPWEQDAINHCRVHSDLILSEPHKVVMPMGGIALRRVLGLGKVKGVRVQDFHGTVTRDPSDRFWVVPTYHPSHLQRGASNLTGTVCFDLQRAHEVAARGWAVDPASVVVDPSIEWFSQYVDTYIAAVRSDPYSYPLGADLETPDKAGGRDEGELGSEDRSYKIDRVNLSFNPDEGVTVPGTPAYLALVAKAFAAGGIVYLWNAEYDWPRLRRAATDFDLPDLALELRRTWDIMWAWHALQSDLPRGLGFAAPFYSRYGAWKHLAYGEPGRYAAIDGFQTRRVGDGVVADLIQSGMWDVFERHMQRLHYTALRPAQDVGVLIDRAALVKFKDELTVHARRLLHQMQGYIPEELRPLTPKGGMKHCPPEGQLHAEGRATTLKGEPKKGKTDVLKQELYAQTAIVVEITTDTIGYRCVTCGGSDLPKNHRCTAKGAEPPELLFGPIQATRYFWQEPFNPDSPKQVLAYIKHRGHAPGRAKKTRKETTDKETLTRLARGTGDPLYQTLLDYRAINKVKGTYAEGTERRLDANDRVHPVPTFKPSTLRLSYVDPNITNVIADKGGEKSLASGFRRCVVAGAGCRLLEVDYSSIEAVVVGWKLREVDPADALNYIRLAKLGVHAGLASHILGRPYDPKWSDQELSAYFKEIKKNQFTVYDRAKRCVHGKNYGLTIHGMVRNFPKEFPDLKTAKITEAVYNAMCPSLPRWHALERKRAYDQGYLGGPGQHPYGYKHWFWSVISYKKITFAAYVKAINIQRRTGEDQLVFEHEGAYFKQILGEDSKRCVAFFPQSIAAGVLKEAELELFDPESSNYIGDAYYGRTPLRAPIHDSLLMEVPVAQWDRVTEKVYTAMLRPVEELPIPLEWGMGEHLQVGIAAKASAIAGNWEDMEDIKVPGWSEIASDEPAFPVEDDDQDDFEDLQTVA